MAAKTLSFGRKSIYLPTFTVALIRTPKLSPYQAKFQVPLNFSKFDLRDYLYNAYNVRALSIRSHIVQQAVRDTLQHRRQLFRPESKKYMTIEMERPFVWPANPDSWEPWGTEEKERSTMESIEGPEEDRNVLKEEKLKVRETAKEYLRGARKVNDGERAEKAQFGGKGKVRMGLKEWERRRTGKVVEADEPVYKIRV